MRLNLIKIYLTQIRIVQWLKNLLIFLPIIIIAGINAINSTIVYVFLSFSFLASSFYCLNDLKDFKQDRNHSLKKNRPFASGKISKIELYFLILLSFVLSIIFYLKSGIQDTYKLYILYIFLNFLYNFIIKKIKYLDIIFLVSFYYIRIAIGESVYSMQLSYWVIIAIIIFLIQLSIMKRYYEILKITSKSYKFKNYSILDLKTFNNITIINILIFLSLNLFYIQSTDSRFLNIGIEKFLILETLCCYLLYNIFILIKNKNNHKDFFELTIGNKNNWTVLIIIILLYFT